MDGRSVIFCAEDNQSDIYLLRLALEMNGVNCELRVFSDGEEALHVVKDAEAGQCESPDIFILDLNLPKLGGHSLLRHLRQTAKFGRLPVIVWTSSDSPRDREISDALAASRHVQKPSTVSAFMELGGIVKGLLAA
jgi:chemotaxis family two-component system response regulator Rcp1